MLIASSLSNSTGNELDQRASLLWEIAGRNTVNLNFFILMNIPSYFTVLKLSEIIYFKGVCVKHRERIMVIWGILIVPFKNFMGGEGLSTVTVAY